MSEHSLTVDELIERERACGVPFGPFWRAKYLDRAPEMIRRQLALAASRPRIVATRNAMETPLPAAGGFAGANPPTSFSPVVAATETELWSTAAWTAIGGGGQGVQEVIPQQVWQVCWGGIYSNRTTSSPASTWTPRFGTSSAGATIGASAAVYSGAALTNAPMYGEVTVGLRSETSRTAATVVGGGFVARGNVSPGTITQPIAGVVTAIDPSDAALGIYVGHTWSATNASNTLTVQWVYMALMD